MKKFILKLDLHDDKDKRKALKTISSFTGIDSMAIDMNGKTLTVIGTVDPVRVVSKLRKFWPTHIILVGPAKEPEKKMEPKKEEAKKEKEEGKKEEAKPEEAKKEEAKPEEAKKEEAKKEEPKKEEEKKSEPQPPLLALPPPPPSTGVIPFRPYYLPVSSYYPPAPSQAYYHVHQPMEENQKRFYYVQQQSMDENPSTCVIF